MQQVMADGVIVRFLGTGPAGGRPGRGRSHRMESSLLIECAGDSILIDATRDFSTQARAIEHVDLALLTHAHRDASGGLARLDRWSRSPVPVWAARATVCAVRARYRRLAHVKLDAIASGAPVAWRGWRITPLSVPHARDCTTYAWRLERAGIAIVYASDVARLTDRLAALCDGCDLLVLDGAMWGRPMFTHLEIRSTAPIVARWPARRILFTQLGRSTPPHRTLDRWLYAVDPKLGAAYDGLTIRFAFTSAVTVTG